MNVSLFTYASQSPPLARIRSLVVQTHLHQQQTSTPHASLASISFTSTFHKIRKNFFSGLNSSLLLKRQEFLSTIIFISSQTPTIDIEGMVYIEYISTSIIISL